MGKREHFWVQLAEPELAQPCTCERERIWVMIKGTDNVLRIIREPAHKRLIPLILQYTSAKKVINDVDDIILSVVGMFHPEVGVSRGSEGRTQGFNMIWRWHIENHNDLYTLAQHIGVDKIKAEPS